MLNIPICAHFVAEIFQRVGVPALLDPRFVTAPTDGDALAVGVGHIDGIPLVCGSVADHTLHRRGALLFVLETHDTRPNFAVVLGFVYGRECALRTKEI